MNNDIYLDVDMDFFVLPIELVSVDNIRLYAEKPCETFAVAPFVEKLKQRGLDWHKEHISCFTNHKTSYTHWWIKKKKNNRLIHIDAHSDLYRNYHKDLRKLSNGDIGCYNYIWYGIRDEYIDEIYWVIPDSIGSLLDVEKACGIIHPDLIKTVNLDDSGLHIWMECVVITGEAKEIPIHVCTIDKLPMMNGTCQKVTLATSPEFIPAASDEMVFEYIEAFGADRSLAQNIYNQHKAMLQKTPEEIQEAWEKIADKE